MIAFIALLVSCASNEQKAEKLIKTDLEENMYDFESYDPIKTTVSEAKQVMYNDTACRNRALRLYAAIQLSANYLIQSEEAKEHMEIWTPSHYATAYHRSQYVKYREQYLDNKEKAKQVYNVAVRIGKQLQGMVAALDTSKVMGWSVSHRFRCKNRTGESMICNVRYLVDSGFSNVVFSADEDDDNEKNIVEMLNFAVSNEFEYKE